MLKDKYTSEISTHFMTVFKESLSREIPPPTGGARRKKIGRLRRPQNNGETPSRATAYDPVAGSITADATQPLSFCSWRARRAGRGDTGADRDCRRFTFPRWDAGMDENKTYF